MMLYFTTTKFNRPILIVLSLYFAALIIASIAASIPSIKSIIDSEYAGAWEGSSLMHPLSKGPLGEDFGLYFLNGLMRTLTAGLLGAFTSVVLGALLGSGLAYCRGFLRQISWYVSSSLSAFPMLFVILLYAAFKTNYSLHIVMLIFGVFHAPEIAEQVKHKIMELRKSDYVNAARSLGHPERVILVRHILVRSCAGLLAMSLVHTVRDAIIVDISIAILGLGLPQTPSLGYIMRETYDYTMSIGDQPIVHWMSAIVLIGTTILALNTLGEFIGARIQVRRG